MDDCAILRVEIPSTEKNKNDNPFDRKTKNIERARLLQIKLIKREAINKLSGIKFSNAKKTDINGFFAAAIDRFNLAPKHFQKILIISSDLQDNVGFNVKLDLSGVKVVVLGFQVSKDPAKTRTLKNQWTKRLKEAGASKVLFLPVEEKFNMDLFKET